MLNGLLVTAIILISLVLAATVVVGVIVVRRLSKTVEAAEAALEDIRRELPPTLRAAQDALKGIESLAARTEEEMTRVDQVLRSADRLISGVAVADAAMKAVRDSRTTVVSLLAGLKEGLKVLRSPAGTIKED
ncbi:MAG TPA: DUF948 domain-containing protein [Armatimonadota bacterium]|nr:DUF948 domain-containing protein [Armatimonadota bacterium]HOM71454.1 DUF948 domain-containing protein [Armatimonadota bacterium]HPP75318.1 DUF948 domain-containing protein [Armatimonadota bacterium]